MGVSADGDSVVAERSAWDTETALGSDSDDRSYHWHQHIHYHHHHYYYHGTRHAGRRRYAGGDGEPLGLADGMSLPEADASPPLVEVGGVPQAWAEEGPAWADSGLPPDPSWVYISRRGTQVSSSDSEGQQINPHWDDMMTFRQTGAGRAGAGRTRAWSASSARADTAGGSWVAGPGGRCSWLTVLPVATAVAWAAVPLRTDADGRLDFWFFLLFYYGLYNAVALALVTQIFRVYALTWWPRKVSGLMANVASWVATTALGALVYACGGAAARQPLTWTALTLLTLLGPVCVSFFIIQRRQQPMAPDRCPLLATSTQWRTPASYRRFLWFCASFLLWYAALAAGELLARAYIATLPHRAQDGLIYVYAWFACVNALSLIAGWVVSARVRSWPLQYIYTLYFFATYFVFHRSLFARLETPEQALLLQLAASLGVAVVYPLRMARWVYRISAKVCRWGDDYPYDSYARQLGRSFFLRNKAENATILGFLCCASILHFGPNRHHYPLFRFDYTYDFNLTVQASLYAWASEFVASRVVRYIFRRVYSLNISDEASYDFCRYSHVVPALVLVTIHVLQNIVFATIDLDFSHIN
ncbi:hypothetical protein GGF46_003879 [Coemansia sp. RSA 552]|nr:hypothetical protein GGF46_003879 [Coemansia sp. RSA 552]